MGNGTNTAEWKTTQRDICRSSYYSLSKSTTERLYYFVVKSTKIKSSSNFSLLYLSTALLLKQKKNKIPGFYIACTSGDPQAMESAWDKRINLFYRFWEVHSQGEWGQPAEKKDQRPKSDEQVTSYHQKCQWNKIADFLLLKNSKPLDVKLFWIGSVNNCVQIARAQKTIAEKMSLE